VYVHGDDINIKLAAAALSLLLNVRGKMINCMIKNYSPHRVSPFPYIHVIKTKLNLRGRSRGALW
jgi:hypothetical protein